MKETDYPAVRPGDCLFDPANPAFYIRDYRDRGKSLAASYSKLEHEDAHAYWARVLADIENKYWGENPTALQELQNSLARTRGLVWRQVPNDP